MDSVLPLAEFLLGACATVCGGSFWFIQQRVSAGKKEYAIKRDFEELRTNITGICSALEDFEGNLEHKLSDFQKSLDYTFREVDSRFDGLDRELIELRAAVNTSIITSHCDVGFSRRKEKRAPQDWEARRLSEADLV